MVCDYLYSSISGDMWFVSGIGGLQATLVVVWWFASVICGEICKFASGIGGDMVGMAASDAATRGKDKLMGGKGETGWERMGSQQQEDMRQEMEQSILAQYGMIPGGRYDNYLNTLGMG